MACLIGRPAPRHGLLDGQWLSHSADLICIVHPTDWVEQPVVSCKRGVTFIHTDTLCYNTLNLSVVSNGIGLVYYSSQ